MPDFGPAGVGDRDAQADLGGQIDLVARGDPLPLRHDAIGAVDLAPDEVLHAVVTVEPAAALPELRVWYQATVSLTAVASGVVAVVKVASYLVVSRTNGCSN